MRELENLLQEFKTENETLRRLLKEIGDRLFALKDRHQKLNDIVLDFVTKYGDMK